MKKLFVFAVLSGFICLGLAVTGEAQPIRVGSVINLTGPSSSWGQYHAKGEEDYFRYVNDVKGGVVGRKIEVTIVDHAYKVPEAVKFTKKFCEEKMDMISNWDAGSGIQVKPISRNTKYLASIILLFRLFLTPQLIMCICPLGVISWIPRLFWSTSRPSIRGKMHPR